MSESSVHVDGLNAIKNNDNLKIINDDITRSKDVQSYMQNYIDNISTLQGEMWDKSRGKIAQYQAAFQKRGEVCRIMLDAINTAIQIMLDYLGEDLYLDPNELDELKATVLQCEKDIASLQSMIAATTTKTIKNKNGTKSTITVSLYSESEKAQFRAQIAELQAVIKECKRLIAKIEGLEAIYQKIEGILNEAKNHIKDFKDMVDMITPSQKVTYVPS